MTSKHDSAFLHTIAHGLAGHVDSLYGEFLLSDVCFAHKDKNALLGSVVLLTGDSLDGLSLAEQRERVDVIARRFRVYNDGRAPRPRELMPPE